MKLFYLFFVIIIAGCSNSSKDRPYDNVNNKDQNTSTMIDEIFKKKVIIILSQDLEGNSKQINIQDYIQNGKSFIPVFTSFKKFEESTKGAVKNHKIEIDGIFLLSILHGNETLKVNPGLSDEIELQSSELIKKYNSEI